MQAWLGIQVGPIFRNATENDGAKMDRGPVGRCVGLRDDVLTLRNRLLPAEGKRARDRVPGAVHMEARFGGGVAGFLGRRGGGGILAP